MRMLTGFMFALVTCGLLAGCASVKRTYLAGGQAGYSISCSSMFSDWSGCLVKAGTLCQSRGYTVSFRDDIERKLLVSCNASQ